MDKELIILAIYIATGNRSRVSVEQEMRYMIDHYQEMYKDVNKDVKTYWFPTEGETRVECVYPPPSILYNNTAIENELLKIYHLLANAKNDEAKDIIRDIERKLKFKKINDKLNETERL